MLKNKVFLSKHWKNALEQLLSKDWFYLVLLVVIAAISHLNWFNLQNIITYGDWWYWPSNVVKEMNHSAGPWLNYSDFGNPNIQIPFNVFQIVWSFVTKMGFSYDVATKFTFFIPIAIFSFVSPFLLIKKLTNNREVSFTAAIFYGSTTYGMFIQPPIQFIYAFAPLFLYFLNLVLDTNSLSGWLLLAIIYSVCIGYEIRIASILLLISFIYFLFLRKKQIREYLIGIISAVAVTLLLNLYWILPTLISKATAQIAAVADRGLFGNWLFDISHAITLFNSSWTGSFPNDNFIKQPIIWYFWFFPIVSLFFFFFTQKKIGKKYRLASILFLLLTIVGIFLTKQSDRPFPVVYQWLYVHVFFFSLFREASKFYLVTAVGYLGLIALSLGRLWQCRPVVCRVV